MVEVLEEPKSLLAVQTRKESVVEAVGKTTPAAAAEEKAGKEEVGMKACSMVWLI